MYLYCHLYNRFLRYAEILLHVSATANLSIFDSSHVHTVIWYIQCSFRAKSSNRLCVCVFGSSGVFWHFYVLVLFYFFFFGLCVLCVRRDSDNLTMTTESSKKYVCITTKQSDTKSNLNNNPTYRGLTLLLNSMY